MLGVEAWVDVMMPQGILVLDKKKENIWTFS